MKSLLAVAITLLIALQATSQPLQRVMPEQVGMSTQQLRYADQAIQKAIDSKQIPGAVLAVVRQGKMAYLKAYGNKQTVPTAEPMTVNTVFDMASCTKPIATAISAMILIEQGKLRLSDKVSLYVPSFTDNIRVIDLFTHTSGLPAYAPISSIKAKHAAPNPSPSPIVEYIATCKRDTTPETAFKYSCLNYITLQQIIETISGKSLRDFAKENIYDVLGMDHTDYNPTGKLLELCAPTERLKDGSVLKGIVHDPLAREMNGGISGNAGIFSCADDLAILSAALLNGGEYNGKRILSPMGVQALTHVPASLASFGRSLGWDVSSPYSSNKGDLFGPNAYGHTGYTGTSIVIDPDTQTAVILLTNRVHPEDKGEVTRLRTMVANVVAASIYPPARKYTDHYYQRTLQFENENPITDGDIVMLGDSMTENGGDWGTLLNAKHVRNRGIIGDDAMGVYDRLYQILPGKPKTIYLMLGVNDVSHNLSADSVVTLLTTVIDRIQSESPKTKLYLQSLIPINESFGRYKTMIGKTNLIPEINQKFELVAAQKKIQYINLYPFFTEKGTNVLRKELTTDGLHLTKEGYDIWSKQLR
ncbi:serine hydrolase [uncultured Acetobacteroides sp.]|uniref:serine hydrolase n=1 Tax=uncultured Acetobacteroides sp. TaxID=1760811 RepID=UPI0029F4ABAD|nr:serine hydrolase [uncultured Acetobacteroides sp.]